MKPSYIRLIVVCMGTIMTLTLTGCYDDDSTGAVRNVQSPQVSTAVPDTINLYVGDHLVIQPTILEDESDLSYEWSIGTYAVDAQTNQVSTSFENISTERNLDYRMGDLGHYYIRQVVSNEWGNTIRYYHVFVRSEFEEGYLILGRDEQGHGSLAFMKTLTPEDIANGETAKFRQNLFAYVNEESLGTNPISCSKVYEHLFIMCNNKIYQIDAKSFKLVYTYDFNSYQPGFEAQDMVAADGEYRLNIYVTGKNGGVARVYWPGLDIYSFPDVPTDMTFDLTCSRPDPQNLVNIRTCYANRKQGIVYAYGFDMTNTQTWFSYLPCYNYFEGREILQVMFDRDLNLLVISKVGDKYMKTKIGSYITSLATYTTLDVIYDDECPNPDGLLTQDSQLLPEDMSNSAFFYHGNKVYRWYYNQTDIPQNAFIEVPSEETITAMSLSEDNSKLIVGTYNAGRTQLKGSMYVYDTDSGKLLEKHEGVADRPVTVMYKNK